MFILYYSTILEFGSINTYLEDGTDQELANSGMIDKVQVFWQMPYLYFLLRKSSLKRAGSFGERCKETTLVRIHENTPFEPQDTRKVKDQWYKIGHWPILNYGRDILRTRRRFCQEEVCGAAPASFCHGKYATIQIAMRSGIARKWKPRAILVEFMMMDANGAGSPRAGWTLLWHRDEEIFKSREVQ